MTGHDPQLLAAHALGLLTPAEAETVDRHLRTCAACRAEWARSRETADLVAGVPPETLVDGPPPRDLPLRRALREIGGSPAGDHRLPEAGGHPRRRARRRSGGGTPNRRVGRWAAAAAAVLALVGGGVVAGRLTAPGPAGAVLAAAPGARTVTGEQGAVRMTASLAPADGWVRVEAALRGVPPGRDCTLVVVGADGTARPAAHWRTAPPRDPPAPPVAGSALIEPALVRAVAVRDDATGATLVETPVALG
ncbi:zf-HC2 domain-containing protein [Pseudonocardia sp. C8]|uniref:zf-HC2 domain-containing protein n=1 Tax=Pseudonocardia sp. C8 TaxID=2762759 RepID=UPI001642BE4B|nr:zf-HC2 domain-containing protein [Pseudonocardia sp. C8]MBC3192966.1 zf-HC2 domain-containing protein [Pseudonocardia sp. C8]